MAQAKNKKTVVDSYLVKYRDIIEPFLEMAAIISVMFVVRWVFMQTVEQNPNPLDLFRTGFKNVSIMVYCLLIWVVLYGFVQKNFLEKIRRKLHLPESKKSKFNECGLLITFKIVSLIVAVYYIVKENWFADLSSLWIEHPHKTMSFLTKDLCMIQFSYLVHVVPEFKKQNIKDDIFWGRMKYTIFYLTLVSVIYITDFHRIGIIMLTINNFLECTKHAFKLIKIIGNNKKSRSVRIAKNVFKWSFFTSQLTILILSQTTLWYYGLKSAEYYEVLADIEIPLFKLFSSISAFALQAFMFNVYFNKLKSNDVHFAVSFGLFNHKSKVVAEDISTRNIPKAADKKFNEVSKVVQNNKKTLKKKIKKAAKRVK